MHLPTHFLLIMNPLSLSILSLLNQDDLSDKENLSIFPPLLLLFLQSLWHLDTFIISYHDYNAAWRASLTQIQKKKLLLMIAMYCPSDQEFHRFLLLSMGPPNWTTCWLFLEGSPPSSRGFVFHLIIGGALLTEQQMILWSRKVGSCLEHWNYGLCENIQTHMPRSFF